MSIGNHEYHIPNCLKINLFSSTSRGVNYRCWANQNWSFNNLSCFNNKRLFTLVATFDCWGYSEASQKWEAFSFISEYKPGQPSPDHIT